MREPRRTYNMLILFCFAAVAYCVIFFSLRALLSTLTTRLADDMGAGVAADATLPEEKIAYLTFDDGPSKHTAEVLDILDEYGIKAAFFVNYRDTTYYAEMLQRIHDEGHTIGNHTYSHEYRQIYASADHFSSDFEKLQHIIADITGTEPTVFRYPGGSAAARNFSKSAGIGLSIFEMMDRSGLQYYDWNAEGSDQIAPLPSGSAVASRILDQTRHLNTAVVLMHDAPTSQNTVDALPAVIEGMLEQGFTFRRLDSSTKPIAQFVYHSESTHTSTGE